ncbi:MAG: ABC transporter ATP-binding protein [Desulfovibrionaceae bacterium]|nr:ABC transporter ATP-binding protein [Desulfovibrionaceae bacterium]
MAQSILEITGLTTRFTSQRGVAKAVDDVSLSLAQGETLGLVGESGCGKTVLALSLLGLVPDPPGRVTAGSALFQGQDLLSLDERQLRRVRGNKISMIFQEPMTSLNPVFRVGEQIAEAVRLHQKASKARARERAEEMLGLVGIPEPERAALSYPHELSGGMRQRVMIAMALSCEPDILIADEPTTALDVTIQAQILGLMQDIKDKKAASVLLITHDLGVVAGNAQRVAVMYCGQIVEQSGVRPLFREPLHPYTRGLLDSLPRMDRRHRLRPIPGAVPGIFSQPRGCRFNPRCFEAMDICRGQAPPIFERDGRGVRCWLYKG